MHLDFISSSTFRYTVLKDRSAKWKVRLSHASNFAHIELAHIVNIWAILGKAQILGQQGFFFFFEFEPVTTAYRLHSRTHCIGNYATIATISTERQFSFSGRFLIFKVSFRLTSFYCCDFCPIITFLIFFFFLNCYRGDRG